MFQEEASKKPVWQDEDDEVEEAVVDVPLHHRKMYIRKATDATNQKITPKVFFLFIVLINTLFNGKCKKASCVVPE